MTQVRDEEAWRSLEQDFKRVAKEASEWRAQISDALGMTTTERHGYVATLPEAVARIKELMNGRMAPKSVRLPEDLFRREQQPCICPRDKGLRLSTAKGCLEHDSCHHWNRENRAKYAAGREGWSIGPWCPIHGVGPCP